MKVYVVITGAIFGLLAVVHLMRMISEHRFATDPPFVLLTLLSAALCVWAVFVLKRSKS